VRFTPLEIKALKTLAQQHDVSVSHIIRQAVRLAQNSGKGGNQ
jgi:transposase-like protein